jgi:hypothetical protein
MAEATHAPKHDRAGFTLALAGLRRDATHV